MSDNSDNDIKLEAHDVILKDEGGNALPFIDYDAKRQAEIDAFNADIDSCPIKKMGAIAAVNDLELMRQLVVEANKTGNRRKKKRLMNQYEAVKKRANAFFRGK